MCCPWHPSAAIKAADPMARAVIAASLLRPDARRNLRLGVGRAPILARLNQA